MTHRIFLVEDHAVMRDALSSLFGCEDDLDLCGVAASAEEALDKGEWAECDLLLTDVSLPGMDGIALMERVHTDHPDLPAVVISASTEPSVVARARGAGAQAYLSKAGLSGTLVDTIREVLGGDPPSPTSGDAEG